MMTDQPPASVFEETTHVATGHGTANPVARSLFRQPTWNRRKEILYGTRDKVHPDSTKTRRQFKIAKALGTRFTLYSWMLNGVGPRDHLKFYIDHAAEQIGVNEKTIDRQLASLEQEGWISRKRNIHGGNRTYSTYILNPISEIIGDDGHGPKLKHFRNKAEAGRQSASQRRDIDVPTCRDTDVPTKRAIKPNNEKQTVLTSPSSSPSHSFQGAKQAEAGRVGASPTTASAGFATKGGTHSQQIHSWIEQNEKTFTELGFKHQRPATLAKDILRYTDGDDERWNHFVEDIWPLLLEQCRASEWLSEKRCRVGFGWLFLPSVKEPGNSNLQVFMFTRNYTNISIPDTVWKTGHRVWVYGHPTPAIIRGFRPGSLLVYRVHGETVVDPQAIEDNTYEASLSQLSDAEGIVLASCGISDVLAVEEKPVPASDPEDEEDERKLQELLDGLEDN